MNNIPPYLSPEKPTCGSISNYQSQTWKKTGSKLVKEYDKAVYCHPVRLTDMQSTSCKMLDWMNHKLESILLGKISTTSDIGVAEGKEEWRSLLMKVKEKSEKAGLKLSPQKTKIMENYPITSWQIESKKWKQWQILLSWAPKSLQTVTVVVKLIDLLLGRKAMTNQDSIL